MNRTFEEAVVRKALKFGRASVYRVLEAAQ